MKNTFLHLGILCLGLTFWPMANSAQLVIIIDDLGNSYSQGNAIIELNGPLTLAFLPHTPYAKSLAKKAHKQHKEIILHAPMQTSRQVPLGPGGLTLALSKTEFKNTLAQAINSIPHIQGVNNHMGSTLTQNTQAMQWVMETLQNKQLYFVDSLTSAKSVAYQQALDHQLPVLRRHVFLDNDKSKAALTRQWNEALRIAKESGHAILIGHPYAESHAFLAEKLPLLAEHGIELIPASQLFLQRAWQAFAATPSNNRYDLSPGKALTDN